VLLVLSYQLSSYKIFYNNSNKLNRADGVVMYIRGSLVETTQIENINDLSILSSAIKIDKQYSSKISALYRCHNIDSKDFKSTRELKNNKNVKNHCIIGDFNIDLMTTNSISQDLLIVLIMNTFLISIRILDLQAMTVIVPVLTIFL